MMTNLTARSVKLDMSDNDDDVDLYQSEQSEWDSDDDEEKVPVGYRHPLGIINAIVSARSAILDLSDDDKTYKSGNGCDSNENNAPVSSRHPLDIIVALYLCSDPFLQQELARKMSLCQFSVPLILPNCDTKQMTFLLWTVRDIVKRYRPHSLPDPKGFVEERLAGLELPIVSFVRLGKSKTSKSHTFNMLLSNPQQYNDTFFHRNMELGDSLRMISNGLVEISWYLPCGKKSIDIFPEPVAVANLRGDISECETQYRFLCQKSTAVFVFVNDLQADCEVLCSQQANTELFLVCNTESSTYKYRDLKDCAKRLGLSKKNVILKDKKNDANFVKTLRSVVADVIKSNPQKMALENMTTVANDLGILLDEYSPECQNAKRNSDTIISQIQDIEQFKKEQLPLQGYFWKELSSVEKEMCTLKKAENQDIEKYKSDLRIKERELREQQRQLDTSVAMTTFIQAVSTPGLERMYFLKWLRMSLDSLSSKSHSMLREQCRDQERCRSSKQTEGFQDKKMADSLLGIEHFFREMGQLYESETILSKSEESAKQILPLSRICAELLLEGFPIELVDGEASNIPIRWIKDLLTKLNDLVQPNNKMVVVTVLGVKKTGKSTLLNTMFGVQFDINGGRCTKGAFMVLIRLKADMKEELKCDFLLIIDTEGLKSPDLTQRDHSNEQDNELATLAVGVSDVMITNIAMENFTEMKDVLQIGIHAFLAMKEVGKRLRCLFVHQNVADVSAHRVNMKDRKIMLEQLNEMTQAACRMENKDNDRMFTDVMMYDPETDSFYVPGLWQGTTPMAPVNVGYCEAVYELKQHVISILKECETSRSTVKDFHEWTESLWKAVKFEKFMFNFRHSFVADAYSKMCTEFSKWEWKYRKDIHLWVTRAETSISNFGKSSKTGTSQSLDIKGFLTLLKQDALTELANGERCILDKVASYYNQSGCRAELIKQYRSDFENNATSLRKELHTSVNNRLDRAASLREGMIKLESSKKNLFIVVEERVLKLIEDCQQSESQKSEQELRSDFEKVWAETANEFSFEGPRRQNVLLCVHTQISSSLHRKGRSAAEDLTDVDLNEYGMKPFTVSDDSSTLGLVEKDGDEPVKNQFRKRSAINEAQTMADIIIVACEQLVVQYTSKEVDYDETYTTDILNKIDGEIKMQRPKYFKITEEFETSLTLHVCASAAREFQKMHDRFLKRNDLHRCHEESKEKYWMDFEDIFHERDQSQRKADEFTSSCLKPAIKAYLAKHLGGDIIEVMLSSEKAFGFNSRTSFQFAVLKQLLDESNFNDYVRYVRFYETFVKNWISDQISVLCPEDLMFKLEDRRLTGIMTKITEAISEAQKDATTSSTVTDIINSICTTLKDHLAIPEDTLLNSLVFNTSKSDQFIKWLILSVQELQLDLLISLKDMPIGSKLDSADMKPQDELFRRVIGCGRQCPFCMAPCEAGGKEHETHFASIHRPQGLGGWRYGDGDKLVSDICSSLVVSDAEFLNDVDGQYHPYAKYMEIFPDWHIQPDSFREASDYWKYVMATFNEQFAKEYKANPGDVPAAWSDIKKKNVDQVLKEIYNMN
ncbi:interferon-induced very large GTPase 1-like [Engraulis encrasicolus]|uniref:interferon-induced very large GTPase 1-like n=1 Tax=Engraulis encrasicolus TaxID=184585 RepID=UPI002FD0C5D8